ncbi:MAG: precorrin-4 C(11)-methyltransferase [Hyphomicrobiales bacterium]|nr:MAG: precorrin-4 C(11)-methyltransferase [Hyphomicrobiales bacterium]
MTVYFIGAGPGAPDLLTIRGRDLIARCPLCLYAGSIVPEAVVAHAPPGTRLISSAPFSLPEIVDLLAEADGRGEDVARVHSGDPAIFSAIGEQIEALNARGIAYEIVPGVPAYAAGAAALARELTLPGIAQSLVLTRTSKRSSPMPEGEELEAFARTGATLALHLSAKAVREIAERLAPIYGADCPAAMVFNASRDDEMVLTGTLDDIADQARRAGISRMAMIYVGRALAGIPARNSALYDAEHQRLYKGRKD